MTSARRSSSSPLRIAAARAASSPTPSRSSAARWAAAGGPFVGREQVLALAKAADGPVDAEAPRLDAEPTQVLHRVADVSQLPIEDSAQTVGPDDQIAVAEVAVHDRDPHRGRTVLI